MNVLITGGAGYIGCVLVGRLLTAGHQVTVVDNLERGGHGLRHLCADPNFTFVRGDVRESTSDIKSYDVLIPLAGVVGQKACDRRPMDARNINTQAVRNLIRFKSKDQLLIYPMTNSGYGSTGEGVCTEDSPLKPISLYGLTKGWAEDEVLHHDNTVSLRLATVFGMSPNMRWDLLVNDFVRRAVTDRCIVVFEGHARRNFVHVRDVADCINWFILYGYGVPAKVFNLGNDTLNMTKLQLAKIVSSLSPGGTVVLEGPGSDPDKRDYVVSSARMRETGFVAQRELADGVKELVKGVALD